MHIITASVMRFCQQNQFIRFCLVGATGLVVDAAVLAVLLAFGLGPFAGRLLSIWAAMTNNWALNRAFTFKSDAAKLPEYLRFIAVNLLGAIINYGVYSAILLSFPESSPFAALIIATGVAVIFNFMGSKLFAFRN
ncbi:MULTISPECIES: GtrA family protein [Pseudovibrio]|uniref:GtrA family protein n=1 Tax=Stappiaceae TaxID=2821832 RepID=UPI002366B91C|nr:MULTISPECIES: GtrA family protein [Pseudovibrio]MDD7910236.1 GtrA family protein [Pseudovibrio exalbescens]MDX5593949.1 GtrA family protein [Pseudovibrio sp. SPO723]